MARFGTGFAGGGIGDCGFSDSIARRLDSDFENVHFMEMSTLAQIETEADALPAEQKQELILFLASRLRAEGAPVPSPRRFTKEQMSSWISEDEADMDRFRRGA